MQYKNKQVGGIINEFSTDKVTFATDDNNKINNIEIKLKPRSHNSIKTQYPNINKENINNDSSIVFINNDNDKFNFYKSYGFSYNYINKDDIKFIDYDNDNQTLVIEMSTKYNFSLDEETHSDLEIEIDLIKKDGDDELLSKINFNSKIEQIKLRIRNDINDIPTLENIKEILEKLQNLEEQKGGYKHNNLFSNDDIDIDIIINIFNNLLDTNITKDDLPYIKEILEEIIYKINNKLNNMSHSASINNVDHNKIDDNKIDDNKTILIIAVAVIVLILLFLLFKKLKKQKTKK